MVKRTTATAANPESGIAGVTSPTPASGSHGGGLAFLGPERRTLLLPPNALLASPPAQRSLGEVLLNAGPRVNISLLTGVLVYSYARPGHPVISLCCAEGCDWPVGCSWC